MQPVYRQGAAHRPRTARRPARRILLAACAVAVGAAVVYGVVEGLPSTPARVLVTGEDCLRAFDEPVCRALVKRALALHNRTAPSFADQSTCEFMMGPGACKPVNEDGIEIGRYGPPIVAILLGRSGDDLLPLYAGGQKRDASGADAPDTGGRAVYFHGVRIGTLAMTKFGGADLWVVTDARGRSITAAAVARLRAR